MNYVYIIVPVCFSLLIFTLTVGYLLLVKYKAGRLLKSIRRDMIMQRCSVAFASKPPDVTHGHAVFTGIYREPSISMVGHEYTHKQSLRVLSRNEGFGSTHAVDADSDVIEVPLRPYVCRSSSSSEGMDDNFYGSSICDNGNESAEEGRWGVGGEGGGDAARDFRKHQYVGEIGAEVAFDHQQYQTKPPKLC